MHCHHFLTLEAFAAWRQWLTQHPCLTDEDLLSRHLSISLTRGVTEIALKVKRQGQWTYSLLRLTIIHNLVAKWHELLISSFSVLVQIDRQTDTYRHTGPQITIMLLKQAAKVPGCPTARHVQQQRLFITGWAVALTCCISHSAKYRNK